MQGHRRPTNSPNWAPRVIAVVVACLAGATTAADYPPPPGAYRSDPASFAEPPAPSAAPPADKEPVPPRPRPLPLPDSGVQRETGANNAARLFGSQKAPTAHGGTEQTPARDRKPEVFAPTALRETPDPPQDRSSNDFRQHNTGQPRAGAYQPLAAPPRQGYPAYPPHSPQYAPAYPAYPPYPGQAMGHAPAGPGYPANSEAYRGPYPGRYAPMNPQAAVSDGGFPVSGTSQDYPPEPDPPATAGPAGDYPGVGTTSGAPTSGGAPAEDAVFRPPSL